MFQNGNNKFYGMTTQLHLPVTSHAPGLHSAFLIIYLLGILNSADLSQLSGPLLCLCRSGLVLFSFSLVSI